MSAVARFSSLSFRRRNVGLSRGWMGVRQAETGRRSWVDAKAPASDLVKKTEAKKIQRGFCAAMTTTVASSIV